MSFRQVTHIIFDLDGLLMDTELIYEKIIADICQKFGKPYLNEVRVKVLGTTEQRSAEIVINELNLPITVAEFRKMYCDFGRQRLAESPLMRGAEKLIRHLHSHKIPFALATSSSKEMVEVKLRNYQELFSYFSHKVMGSSDPEVVNGKPAPDIFLVAAKRFPDNPKPENCLVFEDAPNGVKAARAANMQVIMVPDKHVPDELKEGATLVLKSLEDIKLEQFGLPPLNV